MKCIIREMKRQELKKILRIIRSHHELDARYANREYRSYFRQYGRGLDKVLVACVGRRIVGVSGYFYDNEEARGVYWLGHTYIHPDYRGKHIGGALLDHIVRDLKRRGGRKLFLQTSSDAIYGGAVLFYTNHGFRWEGTLRDFYSNGEDQIIMGKDLYRRSYRRLSASRRRKR